MKMSKSYKILLFVAAFVLSIVLGVCSFVMQPSMAARDDVEPKITDYFSGVVSDDMSFDTTNGTARFTVRNGNEISVKNKLVIDNFETELVFDSSVVKTMQIVLTYDSYYVNGNKKVVVDGTNEVTTFEKTIVNAFEVSSGVVSVKVNDQNNLEVNGTPVDDDVVNADTFYKIRKVEKSIAKVSFKVTLQDGIEEGSFGIKYISQNAADENYKQSFELVSGKLKPADPYVTVNAPIIVKTADGYKYKAYKGDTTSYSLTYNVYSVLGDVASSELYPTSTDTNVNIPQDEEKNNLDNLYFKESGMSTFSICGKEGTAKPYATYTVEVLDKLTKDDAGNSAPVYVDDLLAIEAFEAELRKQYYKDDVDVDANESHYVALGSTIDIPSLEDLVQDDRTPYSKLNKTLYYVCAEPLASNSSLEIKLNVLGDYSLYVVFADLDGKGMDAKKDFIELDEDGVPLDKAELYERFVFSFKIDDDAAISITPAKSQGTGYKGTKYTASKFDIKAVNSTETFTLWFNANIAATESSTGWVEIKQTKDVEEDYSDENGYTYERLSSINYDGGYVFTPDKAGSYMIKCVVSSEVSFREVSASTVIRVTGDPKVVTPANHWLRDNVWSVVFLSIGSVCLVAIVVLLCIKPKDQNESEK